MLWGKTSRPAPRVSTLVPFIVIVSVCCGKPIYYFTQHFDVCAAELFTKWIDVSVFLHAAMAQIEVVEADLECPETGRKFPVTEGIPNMLLREDEV